MDERAYMNRQAAAAPSPSTLNARFNTYVTALNSLCSEAEEFLDRVNPRPPQPQPEAITGVGVARMHEGSPPMTTVASNMEEALQRLRIIINALHQIA